jgi:hypothetical protein
MELDEGASVRARARAEARGIMVERARITMDALGRPPKRDNKWDPFSKDRPRPGDMAKVYKLARRILYDYTPELAAELVDLALNADDERIRFGCLVAALDRAGVKPIDFDEKAVDGAQRPKFDPSLYTFEELEVLYNAMELMARKQALLPPTEGADVAG